MTKQAKAAIDRSVSHNEIVTLDYAYEVATDLSAESEDSVEANGVTEYWGTRDDGEEWRVHLRGVSVSDRQIRALGEEAVEAGDLDMANVCADAINGDERARAKCDRAIRDAAAQS